MKRHTKINFASKFALIVLILAMACIASGCNSDRIGGTLKEPEITVEYLQGEYADQLVRDGAEVVFGTLDVTGTVDGVPLESSTEGGITLTQITINAKEYVEDANAENGYYIADRNKAYITYAGDEARVACDLTGDGTLQVCPIDQFVNSYESDNLYDVYLFDDQVLLIIERII